MTAPPLTLLRQNDTHRLIPCKYSTGGESVLTKIADSDQHLKELFDLDFATNDRLAAENNQLPGIAAHELVFGVPQFRVINATFTHAHPSGSRFNSSDRGAWYAAFELPSSQAEIVFHKTQEYLEINRFDDSVSYDDYLADFSGEFHDLRNSTAFNRYLNPNSYLASQKLAEQLLNRGSLGIVYPSVRRKSGTCLVCFRPPAVGNVRKHYRYRFTWAGKPVPQITCLTLDSQSNERAATEGLKNKVQ